MKVSTSLGRITTLYTGQPFALPLDEQGIQHSLPMRPKEAPNSAKGGEQPQPGEGNQSATRSPMPASGNARDVPTVQHPGDQAEADQAITGARRKPSDADRPYGKRSFDADPSSSSFEPGAADGQPEDTGSVKSARWTLPLG